MAASHDPLVAAPAAMRLLAGLPGAVCTLQQSPEGRLRCPVASPKLADLLGLPPSALCAARDAMGTLTAHVHPDDRGLLSGSLRQSMRQQIPWCCTFRVLHPTRGKLWIEGRATGDARDPSSWHCIFLDLGIRRLAEAPSGPQTPVDAALLQHTTEALFLHGDGGFIEKVNSAATHFLGYSAEELLGQRPSLFDPSFGSLCVRLRLRERLMQGETITFETIHVRKDGSSYPAEVRMAAFQADQRLQAVAAVRDLSQSKRDAEALQQSERRFQQLTSLLPGIVWSMNAEFAVTFLSRKWFEYTGHTSATLAHLTEAIHPADVLSLCTGIQGAMRTHTPHRTEFRMRSHQSGEYRWFLLHGVPSVSEQGEVVEWLGLAIDIDDLKRTEAALREQRDRVEKLAAVAPGILHTYRLCADGRAEFSYASPTLQTQLGLSREDLAEFAARPRDFIHPEDLPRVAESVAVSARDLSPWHCEYRFRHPQRGEIWLEISSAPVREPDGSTAWHGILFDVTQRVRAAVELRESEQRYHQLADALPQVVWTAAPDGRVDFLNARAIEYGGISAATLVGWDWLEVIHPDDQAAAFSNWNAVREQGIGIEIKLRIRRYDGQYRWHVVRQTPSRNAKGEIIKWIGTCTDIHEIMLYEDALRQERDRFEQLVSAVPGVVFSFLLRPDGHASFPFISSQGADLYGLDLQSLATDASGLLARIHPDDLPRARLSMWRSARTLGVWRTDYRIRHNPRNEIWLDGMAIPSRLPDGSILWHGFVSDNTARKLTEKVRRYQTLSLQLLSEAAATLLQGGESAQRTAALFHMAAQHLGCEIVFYYIAKGNELHLAESALLPVSPECLPPKVLQLGERLCGLCAQRRSQLYVPRIPLSDLPQAAEARACGLQVYVCNALVDGDRLLGTLAFASRRKDHLSDVERNFVATLCRYVALAHGRAETEQALRDSEEAHRRLINMLPVAVAVMNERKVAFCNSAFVRLLGAPDEAQLIGRDAFAIVHPDFHALLRANIAHVATARGPLPGAELRVVRIDGKSIPVYSEVAAFVHVGRPAVMVVLSDLSEREAAQAARGKLEEQVRQAHKMEALGRLAGGVAHDFNNLLTVIQGYSDLLLSRPVPAVVQHEALTGIQAASERAARLTRQLLALSRKALIEPRSLDINHAVSENVKLLRRLIREDIALVTVLAPDLWRIKADPGQIDQLIMNLVVNARDAMPSGGRLCIETHNIEIVPAVLHHYPDLQPGPHVRLSVSDTGIGIPRDIQGMIFDPFFTTKPLGEGTGLGLSVVHGIVKQSGGHIGVYSEPGVGTTFQIFLPALLDPAMYRQTPPLPTGAEPVDETILLVEDDAYVRKIARLSLAIYGYQVLEASNGEEALTVSEHHAAPINLILTDLIMPGLSGPRLMDRLRLQRSDLRVIYMSGYTDESVLQKGLIQPSDAFIQKPFTPQQLVAKVQSVLKAKPPIPRRSPRSD
ncbi:MAG: PAS domain-containing protein [Myxococcales bacterium]|nr:PAS domain-containing protein [Myxococcales bacterium]